MKDPEGRGREHNNERQESAYSLYPGLGEGWRTGNKVHDNKEQRSKNNADDLFSFQVHNLNKIDLNAMIWDSFAAITLDCNLRALLQNPFYLVVRGMSI